MIEIDELAIPVAVGAEGWDDYETAENIRYDAEAEIYGTRDLAHTAEEDLPFWHDPHIPSRLFVAREDGRIVGSAAYESEPGERPTTVWLRVDVAPESRRRGIATALGSRLHEVSAAAGASKEIVYTVSGEAPGERIAAPTGFGSVPADNPEVRFLLAQGYRLEQIERGSRLALPIDADAPLTAAEARSGSDFVVHVWGERAPAEWREDVAYLRQRMSTEEPNAGLDEPESVWSVDRVVAEEERMRSSPRTRLTAAVEHRATGKLVGFTTLSVPAELDRAAAQQDTLVLPEQRGHGLGMLLKLANLDQLQRVFPGHPSVTTFNAEENRPMLDVNEALGFVPIGYEGAWRKDL
jgi:GNAT superfamily N-acetyltransferase